jgi:endonuclease YncB( thermonuclease family)
MGLGQWIIIIILVAIIVFGFAAVIDFGKGVISNVYPFVEEQHHHHHLVSYYYEEKPTYIYSKVIRVIDGDTIELETGDKIRLSVVNTPERYENGYTEAKQFTESLCLGKNAIVDIDNRQPSGSYSRLVGAVYCFIDNENPDPLFNTYFLNLALLTTGNAVTIDRFCDPKKTEFYEDLCVAPSITE